MSFFCVGVALISAAASFQRVADASAPRGEPSWFVNATGSHFVTKYSDDLTTASFDSYLAGSGPSKFLLVNFYAPWCPHCQTFILEFESFARSANRTARTAVVDCVREENLCLRWNISLFPTIHAGRISDFQAQSTTVVDATLPALDDWAAANGVEIEPRGPTVDTASLAVPSAPEAHKTAHMWDAEEALAMFLHIAMAGGGDTQSRGALSNFTNAVCHSYPDASCRRSMCDLSKQLAGADAGGFAVLSSGATWTPCGRKSWDAYGKSFTPRCQGSLPGKRGYTCGLWTLFHVVVASAAGGRGPDILDSIRTAVLVLFDCAECRQEFEKIAYDRWAIVSDDDAMLWLWNAHNQVSDRLRLQEAQRGTGDPEWPKMAFPGHSLCPKCNSQRGQFESLPAAEAAGWNLAEVAAFLRRHYATAISGRAQTSFLQ
mmetsp:Transcript_31454/g.68875  ORF Transcript_31454/g.68875 Transcript_31454/m.68875 type:complete len:431 (+) Transcript_31454:39-1331(+)|eukprot:CAMPEP_0204279550 /NCGR_PEP_ID=MMETSP0468-20130131/35485_1 /ASSEMBLY_ACC=CAM_ASM_000383 /TAXON_ID=2969 /ORGANISM="Oxyrrhis marina" /LENGTH=430 /DNA_ID=CAMNT_0051256665 /DNA_START=31 /DNA_END=1323 /DNA_ORIENTATION=+